MERYGRKAYGMGTYSRGDTEYVTAKVDSVFTTPSSVNANKAFTGSMSSTFGVSATLENIGPLLASVSSTFGVSATLQRGRNFQSKVDSNYTVASNLLSDFALFASVEFEIGISDSLYMGPQWVDEEIQGAWKEIVIPSSIWVDENVPPVQWRN